MPWLYNKRGVSCEKILVNLLNRNENLIKLFIVYVEIKGTSLKKSYIFFCIREKTILHKMFLVNLSWKIIEPFIKNSSLYLFIYYLFVYYYYHYFFENRNDIIVKYLLI